MRNSKKDKSIHFRISEDMRKYVDAWRSKALDIPTRPEALRRLVNQGFLLDFLIDDKSVDTKILKEVCDHLTPERAQKLKKLFGA